MSVLDRVLGFFGKDDDDLEATDQNKSPSELQSDGSLRFGGMGAPLGFLTSEYDPYKSAMSLAGPVYGDSMTGKSYVSEPDADQRTDRKLITETVGAVSDAVIKKATGPWEQPQLPSAKQTYDFAKKAATETVDLLDRLASGDGSLLEVLEAATGVGLGAKVAQKAFADPELDSSAFTTGMFLNQKSNTADMAALDRAKAAESNGVDREAIYKDTGWFRFSDEWLYEISDKDTNIKLLQKFKKPLATIEEVEVPTTIGKDVAEQMRLAAMKKIIAARTDFINGDISEAEFEALSNAVTDQYKTDLSSSTGTKTVRTETNPEPPAKDKGTLSEVLVNADDLEAALPPEVMATTAQIKGRRGTAFGSTMSNPSKNFSTVNTFPARIKEYGDAQGLEQLVQASTGGKISKSDQDLLDMYNTGKITKEQFYADHIWGVMLHETQHLIQNSLEFKSGKGGNRETARDRVKDQAGDAIKVAMQDLSRQDGWRKTKGLLKQYTGKGDQTGTGQAFVSLLTFRRSIANITQNPKNKNNDEKSAAALIEQTAYVNKIRASFPSLNAADSTAFAMELINNPDILDSAEVFDRIMRSRAGKLSNEAAVRGMDRKRDRFLDFAAYSHIAGEALARLVEARRSLSAEQQRGRFPLNDLDVEEGMVFRKGSGSTPEDFSIDTTPSPRTPEPPKPPAIKPSVDAEPDPQTILSVKDKDYFATENLNDADLRLKDPVGYIAGDILRFIEFFPNGVTLKGIKNELTEGSADPGSKEFINKTQKNANRAFYTDERLQEALAYIDKNGLATTIPNSGDLIDTQIMPTWKRKKPDGTVLTREELGYPPWPPEAPDAGSIDDQMDAGAMESGPPDGGNNFPSKGPVFTPKTFDAVGFSDEVIAKMAETNKRIKSNMATDAGRAAEQKRIDEKRDTLIEQYITAFTNTLASKGDKVVDLKALKYAMKKDKALGGIEAAARQAADTSVILERMGGDITEQMMKDDQFASMLESHLFVGPKSRADYGSEYTKADLNIADSPSHREYIRRNVEKDYSLTVDQEELITRVFDEGYDEGLLEWAATEHAIRSTLKKMKIPTTGDN